MSTRPFEVPEKAFIEVCQTEHVAAPGSLLDKLRKASQTITDDYLKLIHNPNLTMAQLNAMQERIDPSPSAHAMVGFYEVCPLKALPNVNYVCLSGSADDQIRPEWEQWPARRIFDVKPVVIPGSGHAAGIYIPDYVSRLVALLTRAIDSPVGATLHAVGIGEV